MRTPTRWPTRRGTSRWPHIGINHAVAAGQRAHRTDDLLLRAFAADMTARAYAADGQRDACLTALDTAPHHAHGGR
jgi:hypothetical protein